MTLSHVSTETGNELHLRTSLTDYKSHVGTRSQLLKENRAEPIYVSGIVKTADGYLAFGRRKDVDRGIGEFNVIAGGVRPTDITLDGRISLEAALGREFVNGFPLAPLPTGLVFTPLFAFGTQAEPTASFLYSIEVPLSIDEFTDRFNAGVAMKAAAGNPVKMDALELMGNAPDIYKRELCLAAQSFRPHVRALFYHAIEQRKTL